MRDGSGSVGMAEFVVSGSLSVAGFQLNAETRSAQSFILAGKWFGRKMESQGKLTSHLTNTRGGELGLEPHKG
jgi:hypothetical protein